MTVPFYWRLLFLLTLMTIAASAEFFTQRKTLRAREYAVIAFFGVIMALYGACNDMLTGALSPDYFILGKGVEDDAYRWINSVGVGGTAGISGGFIIGAILVFMRSCLKRDVSLGTIMRRCWVPVAGGIVASGVFALALGHLDLFGFEQFSPILPDSRRIDSMVLVWWEHLGVYFGTTAGTIYLMVWIYRQPRLSCEAPAGFSGTTEV